MTPTEDELRAIIATHLGAEGPLLPILHDMQARFGHVPPAAHPLICDALNISKAELHGVVSFYHDFRTTPGGRHTIKICRAEACQARGAAALAAETLARLRVAWHGTTANGAVTVEPVYCLGLCACGPAVLVDDRPVARVDSARMTELLAGVGA